MLIEIGKQILTFWHFSLDNLQHWPISLEYLVFTIFFTATIWLAYEVEDLKHFSISLCLLGAIGTIYMIDTFYPYGAFTPFQAFVPFTASSAAQVLNWMGYKTSFLPYHVQGTPVLYVSGSSGSVGFGIGWSCAGVQSLFIYTCVILLFLKKSAIPMIQTNNLLNHRSRRHVHRQHSQNSFYPHNCNKPRYACRASIPRLLRRIIFHNMDRSISHNYYS